MIISLELMNLMHITIDTHFEPVTTFIIIGERK